ncbi:MAG: hypothetical protein H0V76_03645 [Blastocatellia bacterium]|nr:hypothetical protein [Blastocatellia bacterium]
MLKNDLHERTWFFDLEWVPDAAGARKLYGLSADVAELDAMQKLWENASGYNAEACPRPFVKYLFSRIVSIAFLSRNVVYRDGERVVDFAIHSLPKLPVDPAEMDEGYLISRFLHWIGEREPQLVGFNSLESDLQVLIQRGMVNDVTAPGFCRRPDAPWKGRDYFESRYGEWHFDICQRLSRYAMGPKLNELSVLCGFPGKLDTTGDQVVDLWLAGDIKKIVEYNQIDTLNTYMVWLRMAYFSGKLSEEDYLHEQEEFRAFLEVEAAKAEREHIGRFAEKWEY